VAQRLTVTELKPSVTMADMNLRRDPGARRWIVPTLVTALLAVLLAASAAAPWLVKAAAGRSASWGDLSNIGQAYGAVSAILSGLAFCGVAGSLILQWRQVRLTQIMAVRERHFELVKLALNDPDLGFSFGTELPFEEKRRWLASNLWVAHWAMQWEMGMITEPFLRVAFEEHFRYNAVARDWWAVSGPTWRPYPDRRLRRFLDIAQESYQSAIASELASPESVASAGCPDNGSHNASRPVVVPKGHTDGHEDP
jgi:hypothetical protein